MRTGGDNYVTQYVKDGPGLYRRNAKVDTARPNHLGKAMVAMNSTTRDNEVRGARTRWALCAWIACALMGCALGAARNETSDEPSSQAAVHPTGAPSLYVVDAANTLQSFDADGNSLRKFQFNPQVGTLNGGLALFEGHVYATSVKGEGADVTSRVFAYDAITLKQVRLHLGAFTVPGDSGSAGAYRAILYNPVAGRFYVASDRLRLLVFDRLGAYIPRTGAPAEKAAPISALAYDSTLHALWGVIDRHTVTISHDGAPLPGLPALGAQYRHGRGAVALAFCPGDGDGADPAGALAVAFGEPRLGPHSVGTGRTYDAGGKPIGTFYGGKIVNAHAMACSSRGDIFIAADNGLLQYTVEGAKSGSHSYSQQLTAPIYGVLATN
jgi:hypothetical protein